MLRGSGLVALVALYPAWRWPDVPELAGFLCVTMFLNGPLAPLLPAAYEPVLMAAGRVFPPLLVAFLGIAGTLYIEFLNYHLYRAALQHPTLEKVQGSRLARAALAVFRKREFFAVWLCAWSPLPFWAVRFLAPMSGYPVGRYLLATFLGRAPRLWFFAALGPLIPLPTGWLILITVVMVAAAIVISVGGTLRHRKLARSPSAPPGAAGPAPADVR